MANVSIEMDEQVRVSTCAQCGGEHPRVHGFLYLNGDAWAVYWADLYKDHPNHPEPKAVVAIALGKDWSEGADPSDHAWAMLDVWPQDEDIRMSFIDPYGELDPIHFGRPLTREAALAHQWKKTFLMCAGEVARKDTRVSALLGTGD